MELLVAAAITAVLGAAAFELTAPARAAFFAQPEVADMHQRLRAAAEAVERDLRAAGAGLDPMAAPAVVPYRVGARDSDPQAGVFYRTDAITARYVGWNESDVVSRTYQLKHDAATNISHLVQYDGDAGEFAIVDHVVALAFTYVGADGVPLDASALQDGAWIGTGSARFDEDLLAVRRVSVRLRVEAAQASMRGGAGGLFVRSGVSTAAERFAPDQEVTFDVAIRNPAPDR